MRYEVNGPSWHKYKAIEPGAAGLKMGKYHT